SFWFASYSFTSSSSCCRRFSFSSLSSHAASFKSNTCCSSSLCFSASASWLNVNAGWKREETRLWRSSSRFFYFSPLSSQASSFESSTCCSSSL
ncbi:unnamed protein product, partial [Closterium sp. NIES-54]